MSIDLRSHKRSSSVLAFSIPGRFSGNDLQLYLPEITNLSLQGELHPYTDYLEEHQAFRSQAEPWNASTNLKKSVSDLKAINLAFPHLQSSKTVLAMAAWFSVLCITDDLVEAMSPQDAEQSLLKTLAILRFGYDTYSHWTADDYRPTFTDTPQAQVEYVTYEFRKYMQSLLPEYVSERICDAAYTTWSGVLAETSYRAQNTMPQTLDEYMALRTRTIGLEAFVVLLESEVLAPRHVETEALRLFKKDVEVIVGLQNDILGLEKDLTEGWCMNFITVASRVRGEEMMTDEGMTRLEDGVRSAVTWHNQTLEQAKQARDLIMAETKLAGEQKLVEALYQFSATHFYWASAARRYQVSQVSKKDW